MLFNFLKNIKISKSLKKEITRYVVSFFFAWLVSALFSDFTYYRDIITQVKIADFLTSTTIYTTSIFLNIFRFETFSEGNFLKIMGTPGVRIIYGCLGIRHFAFLIVFILLQTGKFIHKLWYIPSGIILLFLLNSFRIALIAFWQTFDPYKSQIVHDVASPFIMYPAILFLWIYWLNKYGKTTKSIHK